MSDIHDIERGIAIETAEMNLVALLKPRIFLDRNQWCVLYGDNLQDGIVGFGDSPRLAVYAFNKAWDAIAAQKEGGGA